MRAARASGGRGELKTCDMMGGHQRLRAMHTLDLLVLRLVQYVTRRIVGDFGLLRDAGDDAGNFERNSAASCKE